MMVYMYIHVVSRLELITPNTCTGFIMKNRLICFRLQKSQLQGRNCFLKKKQFFSFHIVYDSKISIVPGPQHQLYVFFVLTVFVHAQNRSYNL